MFTKEQHEKLLLKMKCMNFQTTSGGFWRGLDFENNTRVLTTINYSRVKKWQELGRKS